MSVTDFQQFATEKKSGSRRGVAALKWGVSLALLAVIVYFANFREVMASLAQVDVRWLLAAACLQPVGSFLTAARWRLLLISQGVRIRLWHLFRSCIAANFFKQFMPSTIGGDPVRAYDSWRGGASKAVAVSTLVVDRLLGLAILATFIVIAMFLLGHVLIEVPLLLLWIAVACCLLVATLWAIFAPPPLVARMMDGAADWLPGPFAKLHRKVIGSVEALRGQHGVLAASLALSTLLQINVVLFYYFISRAMGFDVPLALFFVIVPLATFIMLLPVSINGIGVREGAFIVLLGAPGIGIASADAVAFAWMEYGIFLFHGVLGGILYAMTSGPCGAERDPADPHAALQGDGIMSRSASDVRCS